MFMQLTTAIPCCGTVSDNTALVKCSPDCVQLATQQLARQVPRKVEPSSLRIIARSRRNVRHGYSSLSPSSTTRYRKKFPRATSPGFPVVQKKKSAFGDRKLPARQLNRLDMVHHCCVETETNPRNNSKKWSNSLHHNIKLDHAEVTKLLRLFCMFGPV